MRCDCLHPGTQWRLGADPHYYWWGLSRDEDNELVTTGRPGNASCPPAKSPRLLVLRSSFSRSHPLFISMFKDTEHAFARMTQEQASKLRQAEQHEWFRQQRWRRSVLEGGLVGAGSLLVGGTLLGDVGSAALTTLRQ
jgi:hypothetical protein